MFLNENIEGEIKILKQRVYVVVRDGRVISIFVMLWNFSSDFVDEVLDFYMSENGQIIIFLIIVCRNGEEKVVLILVFKFKINLEQIGIVKFDGFVLEGVIVLWCVVGVGYLGIVKFLLECGVDVNYVIKINLILFCVVCFDGWLDVVQCLVEYGVDIFIFNKYNNICLMIISYKGYVEVVRYLFEKGVNLDLIVYCGVIVMYFVVECGYLEVVQDLVRFYGK